MWTKHHKQKKTVRLIIPAISVAFLSYFGYYCIHGTYGLEAGQKLDGRIVRLQEELDGLTRQAESLQKRVALLSDGSIDKDMLDERARYALNLSRADEIVIFRTAKN
ncbi:FtsB family cell division protein [Rhizobium sp. PAMB 3182]